MADSSTIVTIAQTSTLQLEGRGGEEALVRLRNHLNGIISGAKRATTVKIFGDGAALVAATGTVTCAAAMALDTVTINGVVFTAVAGAAAADQFSIDGSDTADAAALAAAINASTNALIRYQVTASSSGTVCTITAAVPGVVGNCMTLATSNGVRLAPSGARLAGGTGGNVTPTTITV